MKKNYTKPEIMYEDFTLSTFIASCDINNNGNPSRDSCGYVVEDEFFGSTTIFTSGLSFCDSTEVVGADGYNGICYHVFSETMPGLFNS